MLNPPQNPFQEKIGTYNPDPGGRIKAMLLNRRMDYDLDYYTRAEALVSRPADKSVFFPCGKFEGKDNHKKRMEMSPWNPLTPRIVQTYVGSIFKREPVTSPGSDPLKDRSGGTEWRKEMAKSALDYETTALLLYRVPMAPIGREKTQADVRQEAQGDTVFVYKAPDVLDYISDDNDDLTMIKVSERNYDPRTTSEHPIDGVYTKYYLYEMIRGTPRCESYVILDGKYVFGPKAEKISSSFKKIPITLILNESVVNRIADSDLARLQVQSDLLWNLYRCGHLQRYLKTSREQVDELSQPGNELPSTPDATLLLEQKTGEFEGEEMGFLEHPANVIPELETRLSNMKADILSSVGIDAGSATRDVSGATVAWKVKTEQEPVISETVGRMERAETMLMQMRDPEASVTYSRDFDLDVLSTLQQYERTAYNFYDLPTFMQMVIEDTVNSLTPSRATDKQRNAIRSEVEAKAKKMFEQGLVNPSVPLGGDGGVPAENRNGAESKTNGVETKQGYNNRSGNKPRDDEAAKSKG